MMGCSVKGVFTSLHFKGCAGKQVCCPVGEVRDSCCVGMHTWPGSKPGSRRSKGNLKITSHPNPSLSTRVTVPGICRRAPEPFRVRSQDSSTSVMDARQAVSLLPITECMTDGELTDSDSTEESCIPQARCLSGASFKAKESFSPVHLFTVTAKQCNCVSPN